MKIKLHTLTVAELKDLLRQQELPTSGSKSELVQRLIEATNSDEVERVEKNVGSSNDALQNQIDDLKLIVGRLADLVKSTISQKNTTPNTNVSVTPIASTSTNVTNSPIVTNQNQTLIETQYTRDYSVKEVAETLPIFDPSDRNSLSVERFIDRVQNVCAAHQFDEKTLLIAVYSRLKGVARLWLDARPVCFSGWISFAEALKKEFKEELDETSLYELMSKAVRGMNETPIDYYFRITALGRKHGLSERAIIKHARTGMRHPDFQSAIAPTRFDSLTEFRKTITEFFGNYAATTITRPVFKRKFQTTPAEDEQNVKKKYHQTEPSKTKLICYNCQEEGHISAKCTKPQKRLRCKDCSRVHSKGEPTHCGKSMNVRQLEEIKKRFPGKIVKINDIKFLAGIDTGSECNLIKKTVVENFDNARKQCTTKITGIGGGSRAINEYIELPVLLDDLTINLKFYIVDNDLIDTDILIGQPIFCDEKVTVTIQRGHTVFALTKESERKVNQYRNEITRDEINCGGVKDEVVETLVHLINEHRDIISTNMSEIGETDWMTMKINLTSNNGVAQAPYRIPEKKKEAVAEMINELTRCNIIEKSVSNYASPILLHKKKDGSDRLCVDYRRLNTLTEKEIFPMPNIEESLHEAKQYTLFTVLDLNSGYYQVPIEPDSRKYTAFVTPDGLYQFKRMPFGLRNAPTVFLKLMSKVKERLRPGDIVHYMDDILVGSRTIAEMFAKLRRVFEVLQEARLTLNLKKCEFMKETITYLGHELTPDGISPGREKTRAVDEFPTPKCATDVRRFLGLSGYFRKFIPAYAIRSEPLRQLLRKEQEFRWTENENKAFNDLKRALTSEPVMTAYRSEAEHTIHTDASSVGLAAVLMQLEENGWKPVIYYSRSTSDLESKYHSSELETLAVVEALERFRYYVYGKPVKVLTDCNAVKSTLTKRDLIPRIGRWSLRIQEFDAIIEHRVANRMEHVDSLSRAPTHPAKELEEATLRTDKIELNEYDWLSALQLSDPKIQETINDIKRTKNAENEQFVVTDNRLFRKVDDKKLWVVPKKLRWNVLHACHDDAGHLALENTLQRIKNSMWFDRMRNFAKSYINACIECSYNKHNGKREEGQYHCDDLPAFPFKTVHLDHLGPFPKSKMRNEHILVLVDAFTKFTIVRPVPSTKTKYVIKILNETNSYFGTPECIVTDRGTAFTSKEFEGYCKDHDIKHVKNAVRTPRANGHAERTNRTILSMLLTACENDKLWDEKIPDIQWALNTLRNKTTQRTPHELLYSFTPRDVTKNKLILALHVSNNMTPTELEEIQKETVERIKTVRQKAKQKYDEKKRTPTKFRTGDLILVENEAPATGTSRKLEPRYKGPFIITSELGHDRYAVEDLPGSKRKQKHYKSVYASDKIRAWNPIPNDDCCSDSENDEESELSRTPKKTGTAEL